MTMKTVRFERHEGLGHIVLANAPKNLINTPFSDCLREAVHQASDSDIRALLVRAEGPNFSHGGDILDFIDKDFNSWRTFICEMHHSYRAIEALQIPTLVAVRGAAYGGASSSPWHATSSLRRKTAHSAVSKLRSDPRRSPAACSGSPSARAARSRRATPC